MLKKILKRFLPGIFVISGSFLIASGWSWYHYNKHSISSYFKLFALAIVIMSVFLIFKKIFLFWISKTKGDIYWIETFAPYLNELFFTFSLLSLIFFMEKEWMSILFVLFTSFLFCLSIDKILSKHPNSIVLRRSLRIVFLFCYFIFISQIIPQYYAYHYYIFDSNIRFYNIVIFRSVAMTLFWLFVLSIITFLYLWVKERGKILFEGLGIVFFFFFVLSWIANMGVLYYSGLYISPISIMHAEGAGKVIENNLAFVLILLGILFFGIYTAFFHKFLRSWDALGKKMFLYFALPTSLVFAVVFFAVNSFRNTPEMIIVRSFYDYYFGNEPQVKLDHVVQKKLEKFGLFYHPSDFFVASKEYVFHPTSTQFLPERLLKNKPNIAIIFLESFSARLTDSYGLKYQNVTPNLKNFTDNKNTTIFKNYYNASTPTITGSMSQLCSFLTPIGHNEIDVERKLQSHRLLCLPEVLKKHDGYKYAGYITAVEKNYANKDGIFLGMGVDQTFGTNELSKYIKDVPLSWGYSDHQLFPAFWNFMKTAKQPFLMMMATNDTHPPFDLPKDAVNYGDGKQPVLNMFHSTDDAFGKFWSEFKNSSFASNTIIVAVADHAIFPGEMIKQLFPEDAKKLTYYDKNFFAIYIPDNILPHEIETYSSGIDLLPTILQLQNINIKNSFEGHSIFDDRRDYPNLLGMHEFGLYINQINSQGSRKIDYEIPTSISCPKDYSSSSTQELTLCDYLGFYKWKRQMFEQGRFWKQ